VSEEPKVEGQLTGWVNDLLDKDVVGIKTEKLEDIHPKVAAALAEVKARKRALPFSGRNPDLGPMIKCQVCGTRHRRNERKCEQNIVTPTAQTRKGILGAAQFAKKRIHPHPNQRKLQYVDLVRRLLPEEYTAEDMKAARSVATRIMIEKWGRHGFLPPIWKRRPPELKEEDDIVREG
jgi:hypothetical protein